MFKWSAFPFVRYALFLAAGILFYQYIPEAWDQAFSITTLLLLFFLSSIWLSWRYNNFYLRAFHGIVVMVFMVFLGGWHTKLSTPKLSKTHYTHYEDIKAFSGTIVSDIEEKDRHFRMVLDIHRVLTNEGEHVSSGLVHVYLSKPTTDAYQYGDLLLVKGAPLAVASATNPGQFDYQRYLHRKRIYGQAFVNEDRLLKVSSDNGVWIMAFGYEVREYLRNLTVELIPDPGHQSIALALILGVKDGLDNELKDAYATAGASHVLAVSGLHVGIIYLFLSLVLKPLKQLPGGSILFVSLTILGIWFYAIITGLSVSVFRAAMMFSILSLADLVGREKNINNSLGIAAFVLLLIDPNYLFQVGFQLSFLAVFGIVYLFPRLYSLLDFNQWLPQKMWSLTCVSLAAQISTVPLSVYYFHQFPTYFILSNWVVIPFSFVILLLGLPMLLFGVLYAPAGQLLAWCLDQIIFMLNFLIQIFSKMPNNTLEGLYISAWQLFLAYGFILAFSWSRQYKTFWNFAAAMIFLSLFILSEGLTNIQIKNKTRVMIYDIRGLSAMDFLEGNDGNLVLGGVDVDNKKVAYAIRSFRESIHTKSWDQNVFPLENSFICDENICFKVWNGLKIALLQSTSWDWELKKPIDVDLLIVSDNSLRGIDQLKSFSFRHLVFDSSNNRAFINKMRLDCLKNKINAHFIPIDGYWSLDLQDNTKLQFEIR